MFFISLILGVSLVSANDFATRYLDECIAEFDRHLDHKLATQSELKHHLNTHLYAKIQTLRNHLEHQRITSHRKSLSYELYKSEISFEAYDRYAHNIHQAFIKNIIAPSASSSGNVTGNSFDENVWSLTFDDGPHPSRTQMIVDQLYRAQIPATFFMLTSKAKQYPKIVDYIKDANMEIALHSYTHKDLNRVNSKTLNFEIDQAKQELEEITQTPLTLFRLPYGSGLRNKVLREKIASNNLIHIFWNVDTLDWKDKDPKSIFHRALKQMKLSPNQSGIILFHDIHSQTVKAVEYMLDYLSKENKKVCLLGDIIHQINNSQEHCP